MSQPAVPPSEYHRRTFIKRLISTTLALVTGFLLYPLLRFSEFKVKSKPVYVSVPAPLPASGFHAERNFLLFVSPTKAIAVSRKCTHLGCRVNFHEDKQRIECPCHQSRFTVDGTRLSGPAEKNLPTYPVTEQKDLDGTITAYVVEL